MATHDISILGAMTAPDTGGDVFFEPLETAMALGTAVFDSLLCLTMQFPTGDDGLFGKFNIPQNYVGTPVLVIRGALGGTPANVLAFGIQVLARGDSEAMDTVLEGEDLASNSTWTGYVEEDMYEETIAINPDTAFVAGDEVFFKFFRDDSADDTTFDFHLTGLFFRYNDA